VVPQTAQSRNPTAQSPVAQAIPSAHTNFRVCDPMPITQDDIDRMNAAIAGAERQVTIGGETVIYRSTADLIRARDDLLGQIARADPDARRRQKITKLAYSGRGY